MPENRVQPAEPLSAFSGGVGPVGAILLTLYMGAIFVCLVYLQIGVWWNAEDPVGVTTLRLLGVGNPSVSANTWLLILVLSMGALGSLVHAATSLADYIGNRQLHRSWVVWFLLRPLIGSALAIVFYFVLRGGLFGSSSNSAAINAYGFAAIAAMAGMFSKQATDKLSEVFDNLFKTDPKGGDATRQNKLAPPGPGGG